MYVGKPLFQTTYEAYTTKPTPSSRHALRFLLPGGAARSEEGSLGNRAFWGSPVALNSGIARFLQEARASVADLYGAFTEIYNV